MEVYKTGQTKKMVENFEINNIFLKGIGFNDESRYILASDLFGK